MILAEPSLSPIALAIAGLAATLILIALFKQRLRQRYRYASFPRIGVDPGFFNQRLSSAKQDFSRNAQKLLHQGTVLHSNSPFLIQTSDVQRLILAPVHLGELHNLPESWLSHRKSMVKTALGRYTGLDKILHSTLHRDVLNGQVTRNLSNLIPGMKDELDRALERFLFFNVHERQKQRELQAGQELQLELKAPVIHKVKAWSFVEHLLNRSMCRVFFGTTVCRNRDLLDATIEYSNDILAVAVALNKYPAILHPVVYPFLAVSKQIKHEFEVYKRVLSPEIMARRTGGPEKRSDLLQWMVDGSKEPGEDVEQLIHTVLLMTRAALPTMTTAVVHSLYDLCNMPENLAVLREEVRGCLKAHGCTLKALHRMRKLDSFIKESQRLNQNSLLSFNRRACRDVPLRDGTIIPSGAIISVARNSIVHDPSYYPNPDKFDPLRFFDKEPESDGSNRRSYTKLSSDNLGFGYGREACPGRFYASAQIKLVISIILLGYEVRYPDGQKSRPGNTIVDERVDASTDQEIELCSLKA